MPAQDGPGDPRAPESPGSPALSSASTAEGELSPKLPALPAPKLSERAAQLLRTPPTSISGPPAHQADPAFLGSPYPHHLLSDSPSSEPDEDSPIHNLEFRTPFLRPPPLLRDLEAEAHPTSISAAAAVLANRARRPARGITEDWIRQHTAGDSDLERRHWFSDGSGDSENSSLSGSLSGDEAAWLEDSSLQTPKARQTQAAEPRRTSRRYPRTQSSSETLRQAIQNSQTAIGIATMATPEENPSPTEGETDSLNDFFQESLDTTTSTMETPSTPKMTAERPLNDVPRTPKGDLNVPATPARTPAKRVSASTPRIRKKVPWKGKNILVLIPRDDGRGKPDNAPMPLNQSAVYGMLKSWEQLGYDISGFDLDTPSGVHVAGEYSQSRGAWPDPEDLVRERSDRTYRVQLPDLNGESYLLPFH